MSFSKISSIAGALALVSQVAAHGTVTGIVADGVYYRGYNPSFQYDSVAPVVVGWSTPEDLSNGFVAPDAYTSSDIICHLGATNAQTSAAVKAGGTVELQWTAWPESHKGPVLDYLANCNGDCTTVDKTTLEFFKIDGVGLLDGSTVPGKFASDTLIANNNSWTVTLPSDIAPGNYVLRHEIIALHSAGSVDGAQNYPQCFNLEVSGSGTATPTGEKATAFYTETDPGIEINIYQSLSTYVVPGPTLYSGAVDTPQTGAASATSVAASATATAASTKSAATTAAAVATSSAKSSVATTAAPTATASSAVASSGFTRFQNGTSTSKTRTKCSSKTTSKTAVLADPTATSVTDQAATTKAAATTEAATTTPKASTATTSADSIPTDIATPVTATPAQATSTSTPVTVADTTAPEGTTLNDLLSWVSSFFSKHGSGSYDSTTTVARRHARDLATREAYRKFGGFPPTDRA